MDPISLAIGAVGLGMSIFGGMSSANNAHQQAQVSADIATQEQGINEEKQKAMALDGRRQQMEVLRNNQRARAMAEAAATNQGASLGSGLQGGLAQITDQSSLNLHGIANSLNIGAAINGYNQAISGDKIKMAQLGGEAATAQAWSSIGGSLMKSGPMIGSMAKGFGGFGGGGNFSGTPGASNTGGLY